MFRRPVFPLSRHLRANLNFCSSAHQVYCSLDDECDDFLPWLERKAGTEISSVLSIGKSTFGRSLCASKFIQTGDCLLKVPYNVQMTSDDLPPGVRTLLTDEVGQISKLAIRILVERKMGQASDWAPYISRLPHPGEIHSTIFWSEAELDMIHCSPVYLETVAHKAQIKKEFLAIMPALKHLPGDLGSITLKDFMHAYALVGSRAWGTSKGLSLIPFADFLNHNGVSEAIVLNDEGTQTSEVIADRDYSPGEEVLIRYGRFSNATLMSDFGFTLPNNRHDQVKIHMTIPNNDPLGQTKLELLQRHPMQTVWDINCFSSSGESFTIKEVKSARGKGKGLPQSLRAFVRVLCCTSSQELLDLDLEAAQYDGRIARRPLKVIGREIEAHQILLSHIERLIKQHDASIASLKALHIPLESQTYCLRRQMAGELLIGELRILNSAAAWLSNYCTSLHETVHLQ